MCDIAAANGVVVCAGISVRFRARCRRILRSLEAGAAALRHSGRHRRWKEARRASWRGAIAASPRSLCGHRDGNRHRAGRAPRRRSRDRSGSDRPRLLRGPRRRGATLPASALCLAQTAQTCLRRRGIQQQRRGWPGHLARRRAEPVIGLRTRWRFGPAMTGEMDYFLLLGLWPAGVLPAANGLTGAAPPFLRFLSAFGFFFSLLLRI